MMDLETIREYQADAAAVAAKAKLEPLLIWPEDIGRISTLARIPNLGNYLPSGWRRVDPKTIGPNRSEWAAPVLDNTPTYFVDKSGMGSESEPALTVHEFARLLRSGYGYGIVVEGQFQIGVGLFKQIL